jgi:hypothetical protein
MTDAKGSITEIRLKEIDTLVEKARTPKGLTAIQGARLDELVAKRDAPPKLSDTCTKYLVELYVLHKYGRRKEVESRAMNKGIQVEEDSITLYSRYKKLPFFKNETNLVDEFFTGTPDNITDRIKDVKSSWDIFTFFNTTRVELCKKYDYQLRVYMRLAKLPEADLAYCLVDTPEPMLMDMKRRLQWKMGLIDADINQDYVDACMDLDRLARYDDIPIEERVNEISITRDLAIEDDMVARAKQCRNWMAATWPEFFDVSKDNQHPSLKPQTADVH